MASVELKQVGKVYEGNVTAIRDANLTINDKEFAVLVGPSGCGKSTLLRMIAGLEEISSGDIYIDGNKVNDVPPKNRDIAMVFQNYALYPHMTVFDNMAFGLKLRKFPKTEIRQRVEEAAEILDIKSYLDRKPKALSGGQRQRVAVGRAIVRKPKVFLFDEPLSNLDAKLRVQMRIEINRLHNRLQTTMIYVTHDQIEAMTMGNKIVVLKDGVIQQVAPPLQLYNEPVNKFVAGFIGSPSMNFFSGILQNGEAFSFKSTFFNFELPAATAQKLQPFLGKEVVLGLRPEHIYDAELVKDRKVSAPQQIKVDVVEPIGNEIFVYFSSDSGSYCMRMSPDRLHQAGEQMRVALDFQKLYFFDAETQQRIV
ncbi:MAG: sn-glycerol-3-phosphate ABC transporter ATP-binding protein UgpC [Calditrichia bacterium]